MRRAFPHRVGGARLCLVGQAFLPVTLALVLQAACSGTRLFAQEPVIRFTDVSKAAGMWMQHRTKHPDKRVAEAQPNFVDVYEKGYYWEIEDLTFLDADGDGNLDVFMLDAHTGRWSRLWLGDGKGGFAEIDPKKLNPFFQGDNTYWRMFAYDFVGKGAEDVVFTQGWHGYDYRTVASLRQRCIVPRPARQQDFRMSMSLMWTAGYTHLLSDVDGDGCVDVVTGIEFDRGSPQGQGWLQCGTVTGDEIELDRTQVPLPVGTHSVAADFDGDGLVDVLCRGYWARARLMRNLGSRHFADVTQDSGLAGMPSGGPVAVADFNQDGLLDIYCSGAGAEGVPGGVKLYLNQGGGRFKDSTAESGLIPEGKTEFRQRFGTATAADFNNDGLVDLFVCDSAANRLYCNMGNGTFKDVTNASGVVPAATDESSNAAGDFDADGRVDLLVVTPREGVGLFRNTTQNASGWIKVRLKGPKGNPEGAGAQVTLYEVGRLGDKKAILGYQEWIVATEFKIPRPLHFGLGLKGQCDVRVVFPGGKVAEKRGMITGQTAVISVEDAVRGGGK